jgi:Tfp pilus assembly protein PilN
VAQQINLFNPIFLRQKRYFSALAMVQAIGLIALGVVAMYAYQSSQNRKLERVAAETSKQLAERRGQLAAFAKQTGDGAASKALIAELDAAEARLVERRMLLDDVRTGVGGDAQGYSRHLAALARTNIPGVWLTGVEIGGKSSALLIRGRALDSALVPAYIAALNREEALAGRRVSELKVTARAEAPPAAGAIPAGPARYLEFVLSIPLRDAS